MNFYSIHCKRTRNESWRILVKKKNHYEQQALFCILRTGWMQKLII